MNKFFKRLALVLVIVMALVMIPVSLAAADPLPADAVLLCGIRFL